MNMEAKPFRLSGVLSQVYLHISFDLSFWRERTDGAGYSTTMEQHQRIWLLDSMKRRQLLDVHLIIWLKPKCCLNIMTADPEDIARVCRFRRQALRLNCIDSGAVQRTGTACDATNQNCPASGHVDGEVSSQRQPIVVERVKKVSWV